MQRLDILNSQFAPAQVAAKESLSVIDNRTGMAFTNPLGIINSLNFRQILRVTY